MATGVNTAKKMTPMTIGLTTRFRSSPNFIQACFSGASQCARVMVTTAERPSGKSTPEGVDGELLVGALPIPEFEKKIRKMDAPAPVAR